MLANGFRKKRVKSEEAALTGQPLFMCIMNKNKNPNKRTNQQVHLCQSQTSTKGLTLPILNYQTVSLSLTTVSPIDFNPYPASAIISGR